MQCEESGRVPAKGVFLVDIQGDTESGLEVFGILGLRAELFLLHRSSIVYCFFSHTAANRPNFTLRTATIILGTLDAFTNC